MPEIQQEKQELIIKFLLSIASRFRNENPPSLFRIVKGSYKWIFKKRDKNSKDEGDGRFQFSVKQKDRDQRIPLQSSIH